MDAPLVYRLLTMLEEAMTAAAGALPIASSMKSVALFSGFGDGNPSYLLPAADRNGLNIGLCVNLNSACAQLCDKSPEALRRYAYMCCAYPLYALSPGIIRATQEANRVLPAEAALIPDEARSEWFPCNEEDVNLPSLLSRVLEISSLRHAVEARFGVPIRLAALYEVYTFCSMFAFQPDGAIGIRGVSDMWWDPFIRGQQAALALPDSQVPNIREALATELYMVALHGMGLRLLREMTGGWDVVDERYFDVADGVTDFFHVPAWMVVLPAGYDQTDRSKTAAYFSLMDPYKQKGAARKLARRLMQYFGIQASADAFLDYYLSGTVPKDETDKKEVQKYSYATNWSLQIEELLWLCLQRALFIQRSDDRMVELADRRIEERVVHMERLKVAEETEDQKIRISVHDAGTADVQKAIRDAIEHKEGGGRLPPLVYEWHKINVRALAERAKADYERLLGDMPLPSYLISPAPAAEYIAPPQVMPPDLTVPAEIPLPSSVEGQIYQLAQQYVAGGIALRDRLIAQLEEYRPFVLEEAYQQVHAVVMKELTVTVERMYRDMIGAATLLAAGGQIGPAQVEMVREAQERAAVRSRDTYSARVEELARRQYGGEGAPEEERQRLEQAARTLATAFPDLPLDIFDNFWTQARTFADDHVAFLHMLAGGPEAYRKLAPSGPRQGEDLVNWIRGAHVSPRLADVLMSSSVRKLGWTPCLIYRFLKSIHDARAALGNVSPLAQDIRRIIFFGETVATDACCDAYMVPVRRAGGIEAALCVNLLNFNIGSQRDLAALNRHAMRCCSMLLQTLTPSMIRVLYDRLHNAVRYTADQTRGHQQSAAFRPDAYPDSMLDDMLYRVFVVDTTDQAVARITGGTDSGTVYGLTCFAFSGYAEPTSAPTLSDSGREWVDGVMRRQLGAPFLAGSRLSFVRRALLRKLSTLLWHAVGLRLAREATGEWNAVALDKYLRVPDAGRIGEEDAIGWQQGDEMPVYEAEAMKYRAFKDVADESHGAMQRCIAALAKCTGIPEDKCRKRTGDDPIAFPRIYSQQFINWFWSNQIDRLSGLCLRRAVCEVTGDMQRMRLMDERIDFAINRMGEMIALENRLGTDRSGQSHLPDPILQWHLLNLRALVRMLCAEWVSILRDEPINPELTQPQPPERYLNPPADERSDIPPRLYALQRDLLAQLSQYQPFVLERENANGEGYAELEAAIRQACTLDAVYQRLAEHGDRVLEEIREEIRSEFIARIEALVRRPYGGEGASEAECERLEAAARALASAGADIGLETFDGFWQEAGETAQLMADNFREAQAACPSLADPETVPQQTAEQILAVARTHHVSVRFADVLASPALRDHGITPAVLYRLVTHLTEARRLMAARFAAAGRIEKTVFFVGDNSTTNPAYILCGRDAGGVHPALCVNLLAFPFLAPGMTDEALRKYALLCYGTTLPTLVPGEVRAIYSQVRSMTAAAAAKAPAVLRPVYFPAHEQQTSLADLLRRVFVIQALHRGLWAEHRLDYDPISAYTLNPLTETELFYTADDVMAREVGSLAAIPRAEWQAKLNVLRYIIARWRQALSLRIIHEATGSWRDAHPCFTALSSGDIGTFKIPYLEPAPDNNLVDEEWIRQLSYFGPATRRADGASMVQVEDQRHFEATLADIAPLAGMAPSVLSDIISRRRQPSDQEEGQLARYIERYSWIDQGKRLTWLCLVRAVFIASGDTEHVEEAGRLVAATRARLGEIHDMDLRYAGRNLHPIIRGWHKVRWDDLVTDLSRECTGKLEREPLPAGIEHLAPPQDYFREPAAPKPPAPPKPKTPPSLPPPPAASPFATCTACGVQDLPMVINRASINFHDAVKSVMRDKARDIGMVAADAHAQGVPTRLVLFPNWHIKYDDKDQADELYLDEIFTDDPGLSELRGILEAAPAAGNQIQVEKLTNALVRIVFSRPVVYGGRPLGVVYIASVAKGLPGKVGGLFSKNLQGKEFLKPDKIGELCANLGLFKSVQCFVSGLQDDAQLFPDMFGQGAVINGEYLIGEETYETRMQALIDALMAGRGSQAPPAAPPGSTPAAPEPSVPPFEALPDSGTEHPQPPRLPGLPAVPPSVQAGSPPTLSEPSSEHAHPAPPSGTPTPPGTPPPALPLTATGDRDADIRMVTEALEERVSAGHYPRIGVYDLDGTLIMVGDEQVNDTLAARLNTASIELDLPAIYATGSTLGKLQEKLAPVELKPGIYWITQNTTRCCTFTSRGAENKSSVRRLTGLPRSVSLYLGREFEQTVRDTGCTWMYQNPDPNGYNSPHRVRYCLTGPGSVSEIDSLAESVRSRLEAAQDDIIEKARQEAGAIDVFLATTGPADAIRASLDRARSELQAAGQDPKKMTGKNIKRYLSGGDRPLAGVIDAMNELMTQAPCLAGMVASPEAALLRFINPKNWPAEKFLRDQRSCLQELLDGHQKGLVDFSNSVETFPMEDGGFALQMTFYTKMYFIAQVLEELGIDPADAVVIGNEARPFGGDRPVFLRLSQGLRICVGDNIDLPAGTLCTTTKNTEGSDAVLDAVIAFLRTHPAPPRLAPPPDTPPAPRPGSPPGSSGTGDTTYRTPRLPGEAGSRDQGGERGAPSGTGAGRPAAGAGETGIIQAPRPDDSGGRGPASALPRPWRAPSPGTERVTRIRSITPLLLESYDNLDRLIIDHGYQQIIIGTDEVLCSPVQEGLVNALQRISAKGNVEIIIWTDRSEITEPGLNARLTDVLATLRLQAHVRVVSASDGQRWRFQSVVRDAIRQGGRPIACIDTDQALLEDVAAHFTPAEASAVLYSPPEGQVRVTPQALYERSQGVGRSLACEYLLRSIGVSGELSMEGRAGLFRQVYGRLADFEPGTPERQTLTGRLVTAITGLFYDIEHIRQLQHGHEESIAGFIDPRPADRLSEPLSLLELYLNLVVGEENAVSFIEVYRMARQKRSAVDALAEIIPVEMAGAEHQSEGGVYEVLITEHNLPCFMAPLIRYMVSQVSARPAIFTLETGAAPMRVALEVLGQEMHHALPIAGLPVSYKTVGDTEIVLSRLFRRAARIAAGDTAAGPRAAGDLATLFPLAGTDVILIDDNVVTGGTAAMAEHVLRRFGVRGVVVASLIRFGGDSLMSTGMTTGVVSAWRTFGAHLWNFNRPPVAAIPLWDRSGKTHLRGVARRHRYGDVDAPALTGDKLAEAQRFEAALRASFHEYLCSTDDGKQLLRECGSWYDRLHEPVSALSLEDAAARGEAGFREYLCSQLTAPASAKSEHPYFDIVTLVLEHAVAAARMGTAVQGKFLRDEAILGQLLRERGIWPTPALLDDLRGGLKSLTTMEAVLKKKLTGYQTTIQQFDTGAESHIFENPVQRDLFYNVTYLSYEQYTGLLAVLPAQRPAGFHEFTGFDFDGNDVTFGYQDRSGYLRGLSLVADSDRSGDQPVYHDYHICELLINKVPAGSVALLDTEDELGRRCLVVKKIRFTEDFPIPPDRRQAFVETLFGWLQGLLVNSLQPYHFLLGPRAANAYHISEDPDVRRYYESNCRYSRELRTSLHLLECAQVSGAAIPDQATAQDVIVRLERLGPILSPRAAELVRTARGIFIDGVVPEGYSDERMRQRLWRNVRELLNIRFEETHPMSGAALLACNLGAFDEEGRRQIEERRNEIEDLEPFVFNNILEGEELSPEMHVYRSVRSAIYLGVDWQELSERQQAFVERLRGRYWLACQTMEQVRPWQRLALRMIALRAIREGRLEPPVFTGGVSVAQDAERQMLSDLASRLPDWPARDQHYYQVVERLAERQVRVEREENVVWPGWFGNGSFASERAEAVMDFVIRGLFTARRPDQLTRLNFRDALVSYWLERFFDNDVAMALELVYPGQFRVDGRTITPLPLTAEDVRQFRETVAELMPGREGEYDESIPANGQGAEGTRHVRATVEIDANRGPLLALRYDRHADADEFLIKDRWLRGAISASDLALADVFDFYYGLRPIEPLRRLSGCRVTPDGTVVLIYHGDTIMLGEGLPPGTEVYIDFAHVRNRDVVMQIRDTSGNVLETYARENGSPHAVLIDLARADIDDFLDGTRPVRGAEDIAQARWMHLSVEADGAVLVQTARGGRHHMDLLERVEPGTAVALGVVRDPSYGDLLYIFRDDELRAYLAGEFVSNDALYPLGVYARKANMVYLLNVNRLSNIDYVLDRRRSRRVVRPRPYRTGPEECVEAQGTDGVLRLREGADTITISGLSGLVGKRIAIVPQEHPDPRCEYLFAIYDLDAYLENPASAPLYYHWKRRQRELAPYTKPAVTDAQVDAFLARFAGDPDVEAFMTILNTSVSAALDFLRTTYPDLVMDIEQMLALRGRLNRRRTTAGPHLKKKRSTAKSNSKWVAPAVPAPVAKAAGSGFIETPESCFERRVRYYCAQYIGGFGNGDEAVYDAAYLGMVCLRDRQVDDGHGGAVFALNDAERRAITEMLRRIEAVRTPSRFAAELGIPASAVDVQAFNRLILVQRLSVLECLLYGSTMLGHDMGIGKTSIGIGIASWAPSKPGKRPGARTVLVVAPNSTTGVYSTELDYWDPNHEKYPVLKLDTQTLAPDNYRGAPRKRRSGLWGEVGQAIRDNRDKDGERTWFVVVNYEFMRPSVELIDKLAANTLRRLGVPRDTRKAHIARLHELLDTEMTRPRDEVEEQVFNELLRPHLPDWWDRTEFRDGVASRETRVELLRHRLHREFCRAYRVLDFIEYVKPEMMIIDEAHRMRNPRTLEWQGVSNFCPGSGSKYPKPERILAVTGTPIVSGNIRRFYPLLHLLDPVRFASEKAFEAEFPDTVEGLLKFHLTYAGLASRYRTNTVCNLPPLIGPTKEIVQLDPDQERIYRLIAADTREDVAAHTRQFKRRLAGGRDVFRAWYTRLNQAAVDPRLLIGWVREMEQAVRDATNIISDIQQGRPDADVAELRKLIGKNRRLFGEGIVENSGTNIALITHIQSAPEILTQLMRDSTRELIRLIKAYDREPAILRQARRTIEEAASTVRLIPQGSENFTGDWPNGTITLTGTPVSGPNEWRFAIMTSGAQGSVPANVIGVMRVAADDADTDFGKARLAMARSTDSKPSDAELLKTWNDQGLHADAPTFQESCKGSDPLGSLRTRSSAYRPSVLVVRNHMVNVGTAAGRIFNLYIDGVDNGTVMAVPFFHRAAGVRVTLPGGEHKEVYIPRLAAWPHDSPIVVDEKPYVPAFTRVVVMTQFEGVARALAESLPRGYVVAYAAGNDANADEAQRMMQQDPLTICGIGTYDRWGEGVTLRTEPEMLPIHYTVQMNITDVDWWSLAQAAARIRRVGQRCVTYAKVLSGPGTITNPSFAIQGQNETVTTGAIDGPGDKIAERSEDLRNAHLRRMYLAQRVSELITEMQHVYELMHAGQAVEARRGIAQVERKFAKDIEDLPEFTRMLAVFFELIGQISVTQRPESGQMPISLPSNPSLGFDTGFPLFDALAARQVLPQLREIGVETVTPLDLALPATGHIYAVDAGSLDAVISANICAQQGEAFFQGMLELASSLRRGGMLVLALPGPMPEVFYRMLREDLGLAVLTEPNQLLQISPVALDFIAGDDAAHREELVHVMDDIRIVVARAVEVPQADSRELASRHPELVTALGAMRTREHITAHDMEVITRHPGVRRPETDMLRIELLTARDTGGMVMRPLAAIEKSNGVSRWKRSQRRIVSTFADQFTRQAIAFFLQKGFTLTREIPSEKAEYRFFRAEEVATGRPVLIRVARPEYVRQQQQADMAALFKVPIDSPSRYPLMTGFFEDGFMPSALSGVQAAQLYYQIGPYIPARTIRELLQGEYFVGKEAGSIINSLRDMVNGLGQMHRASVVHGELSNEKVMRERVTGRLRLTVPEAHRKMDAEALRQDCCRIRDIVADILIQTGRGMAYERYISDMLDSWSAEQVSQRGLNEFSSALGRLREHILEMSGIRVGRRAPGTVPIAENTDIVHLPRRAKAQIEVTPASEEAPASVVLALRRAEGISKELCKEPLLQIALAARLMHQYRKFSLHGSCLAAAKRALHIINKSPGKPDTLFILEGEELADKERADIEYPPDWSRVFDYQDHYVVYAVYGSIHYAVDITASDYIRGKSVYAAEVFMASSFDDIEAMLALSYGGDIWKINKDETDDAIGSSYEFEEALDALLLDGAAEAVASAGI